SRLGLAQQAGDREQRGLAGSRLAGDGHDLPGRHRQRRAVEDGEGVVAVGNGDLDVVEDEAHCSAPASEMMGSTEVTRRMATRAPRMPSTTSVMLEVRTGPASRLNGTS